MSKHRKHAFKKVNPLLRKLVDRNGKTLQKQNIAHKSKRTQACFDACSNRAGKYRTQQIRSKTAVKS